MRNKVRAGEESSEAVPCFILQMESIFQGRANIPELRDGISSSSGALVFPTLLLYLPIASQEYER